MDITEQQDGGVLKEVIKAGHGAERPWKGDRVSVHYVGTLLEDGSKFDSSRDRGQKFEFNLGKGEVIKGWDVGVATMVIGEVAKLTIRSDYGYGDAGSPPKIPPKASLVFEVELFSFEGEDITKNKDKGVIKRTLEAGQGLDHANEESKIEAELKAFVNGECVDDRNGVKFTLGEGADLEIPPGVEIAVEKMKKGEKARISLSPDYSFGGKGVPNGAKADYEVLVKDFERAKESWQLDGEQKLEQAKMFKERGTEFFKKAKFEMAAKKYKKIIEFLEHEISLRGEQEAERKSLLEAGRLNLAMTYLKLKDWIEAKNVCDKVLEENPKAEKGYFRRGEALMCLNEHSLAKADFSTVVRLDPDNKAAKNRVALCLNELKKQKEKEKRTFANMFDKFAQIDAKREEEAKKRQKPLEINEWSKEENGGGGQPDDDPDVIKVTGDVQMDVDLNKEVMP